MNHRGAATVLLALLFLSSGVISSETKKPTLPDEHQNYDFQTTLVSAVQTKERQLGCRIALAFKDKDLPLAVAYRADELFHAASTMKVPVMIEVFRQAEQGRFAMTDTRIISPVFRSIIDDSTFECEGYEYIQSRIGQPETILKLTEQMIVVSDNLATNMLITLCTPEKITATARSLGAKNAHVLRCVEDIKAYETGLSNRITARDLVMLHEAIETNRAAGEDSCAEMRRILLAQEHNDMIPANLPEGVRVGHKTGAITGVRHDAGIVYASFGTYYLALLSDGLKDGDAGVEALAELSRLVYNERMKLAKSEE